VRCGILTRCADLALPYIYADYFSGRDSLCQTDRYRPGTGSYVKELLSGAKMGQKKRRVMARRACTHHTFREKAFMVVYILLSLRLFYTCVS
jgi:hypothetical protein